MSDSTSPEADAKIDAFAIRDFRANGSSYRDSPEAHLKQCDSLRVVDHDMSNGVYGCDTGCEYARLEVELTCDHGFTAGHEYGTFGEMADILDEILRSEARPI